MQLSLSAAQVSDDEDDGSEDEDDIADDASFGSVDDLDGAELSYFESTHLQIYSCRRRRKSSNGVVEAG